jgi:tetratricopeptide (TPR) repeat protein
MAVVCLAHDLKHDRRVAVKFIGEQLGSVVGTQRFLQEIRLTASLQHPHVLSVYDSGVTTDNVLYYVMPFVEGGSLRGVLLERGPLPLRDVIRTTREVADALAFAHQRGIIHRDIKPENILFADGHALVADFGIARLLTPATGEQVTHTGVVVGTPAYMSPEQAFGLGLDARSDVYSLACVAWEMLAGQPPQILGGMGWPPKLRDRADVPADIEAELVRALSPVADSRHAGTRELADALEGMAPSVSRSIAAPIPSRRSWRGGLVAGLALGIIALAGSAFFAAPLRDRLVTLGIVQLDSAYVLVAPFQSPHGALGQRAASAEKALREELARWDGLRVMSGAASLDAVGPVADASLDRSIRAARQARAGLLLRALVHREGDVVTVEAQTIDARSGAVLATIGVPLASDTASSAWAERTAGLLLAGTSQSDAIARATGATRSLSAWRAYARGHQALARWEIRRAEHAFTDAVASDGRFGAARVWLAQTMLWSRRSGNRAEWRQQAEELAATGLTLDPLEQDLALALSALGRRDEPRACAIYRSALRRDSLDVGAWLGLGDCQALDDGVVRDARSPTGYAFRASWDGAMRAYERAVRLSPGAHAALPAAFVERLLPAVVARFRPGVLASDTTRPFAAQPSAAADTVAYFPRPLVAGGFSADPPRYEEALQRNAARLLSYVTAWTQRAPASVDAYEALASIQEVRGELTGVAPGGRPSATAALDSAQRLAADAASSTRLAASRVRVLVKAGEFERARELVDSLMTRSAVATADEAHWLAGVAALTGRAREAARLARLGRTPPVDWDTLPAPVASAATLLLAQSAAGVCDATFSQTPHQLETLIESYSLPAQRVATRAALLNRARRLAVPCLGVAQIASLDARSPWDRMLLALARNDPAGVRVVFDSMTVARRERRPGGTSADYVFIGTWTLAAAGDSLAAERYADLTLNALPTLSRNSVWELTQSAALVRLMALRADLARARHDVQNAQQWSAAVVALWKRADAELQPTVGRMQGMVESR